MRGGRRDRAPPTPVIVSREDLKHLFGPVDPSGKVHALNLETPPFPRQGLTFENKHQHFNSSLSHVADIGQLRSLRLYSNVDAVIYCH